PVLIAQLRCRSGHIILRADRRRNAGAAENFTLRAAGRTAHAALRARADHGHPAAGFSLAPLGRRSGYTREATARAVESHADRRAGRNLHWWNRAGARLSQPPRIDS